MGASRQWPAAAEVYGQDLGSKFGAEDAPCFVSRSLSNGEIAITELCVNHPSGELSDSIPPADAYMLSLLLKEIPNNAYFEEGRQVSQFSLRPGDLTIHSLLRNPAAVIEKPIHSLLIYLPCLAFHSLADQANVPRISELRHQPGVPVADDVIMHLGYALLPTLRTPQRANRLFKDHVSLAIATHCAQTYGGMQPISAPVKGGLAPWQEKRSKEMLAGDLTGTTALSDIAEACGLSVSHFSRAFRASTGLAPHAWLLQARVETAKGLLRRRDISLSVIAERCGFVDQSHFTTVFRRRVGLTPSAWRRTTFS